MGLFPWPVFKSLRVLEFYSSRSHCMVVQDVQYFMVLVLNYYTPELNLGLYMFFGILMVRGMCLCQSSKSKICLGRISDESLNSAPVGSHS